MGYRIGIDAGSKTIKVVVLDADDSVLYSAYRRHQANIRETARDLIHEIIWRHGDFSAQIAVTGSAGIELARILGLPFVQEVIATTHAVQMKIPGADAIIELGGEDAKVIYLSGGLEQRMNATCAGGTGGFIDTMAFMLGVRSSMMSDLAISATRLYPIASRCAVFAQTDVRPLLNAGASKSDIAASVLEAVVNQTLGGLACGRPITGTVIFLGGPLEHLPSLVHRFRNALGLTNKTAIKPPDAHLFTAMGTALLSPSLNNDAIDTAENQVSLAHIEGLLNNQLVTDAVDSANDLPRLNPLFTSEADYLVFKERHERVKVARKRLFDCTGPVYLGIDSGSTTVKLALVDEHANLIYSDYRPVEGDSLKTAKKMIEALYQSIPREYNGIPFVEIAHTTVTGYGETLLQAALNADSGVVETIAHLKSAQHLNKDVSFVLDIGGQDMKALWVRGGAIDNAVLNEACSSGCGSFIEGTAHSLKHTPYSFSEIALQAPSPIDLGTKCTVFMTSRVRHAQKIGATYSDIAAGLCYSVVKNALFKTTGMKNLDDMGDTIIVQGGSFMSDAVLRAFELVSGKQVIRPNIAHLTGAFGAALVARSRAEHKGQKNSSLVNREELALLDPSKLSQTCTGCTNGCDLTIVSFESKDTDVSPRIAISGNKCNRAYEVFAETLGTTATFGADNPAKAKVAPPNLYRLEQRLLARYQGEQGEFAPNLSRHLTRIGLPHALHLYETLPFWHTLLTKLGFTVVVAQGSNESNQVGAWQDRTAYTEGLETVPSESVCYPAKIIHSHIAHLLRENVNAIFFPQYERGTQCPVSSLYARALEDSVPAINNGNVSFVSPLLRSRYPQKLVNKPESMHTLFEALLNMCPVDCLFSEEDFQHAIQAALKEQERFSNKIDQATLAAMEWLKTEGRQGIILAGRPYHVDPQLSHGVDTMLEDLGLAVLSPLGMRMWAEETGRRQIKPDLPLQWTAAKSWLELADYANSNQNLEMVCLYSFGCSFDAISLGFTRNALESKGSLYTALKLDEIVDLSHIRIRLRTLTETLEDRSNRKPLTSTSPKTSRESVGGKDCRNTLNAKKIIQKHEAMKRPSEASSEMSVLQSLPPTDATPHILSEASSQMGDPHPLPSSDVTPTSQEDIEIGRKYISHEACLIVQAMTGNLMNAVSNDSGKISLEAPEVCQSCLTAAIPDLIANATNRPTEVKFFQKWPTDLLLEVTAAATSDAPKIGILGNSLMCYDPYVNHNICDLITSQGCTPVFPDTKNIFDDDVRFLKQIDLFVEGGIDHIIYLQAFGCLKGHIQTRGALRGLQKRYPDLHLTVIDYDSDTSTLNQENRILLALAAAKHQ